MLVSKPSSKAFSAIFLFLLLALAGTGWLAWQLLSMEERPLWLYLLAVLGLLIVVLVGRKGASSYKVLTFEKKKLTVRYPFRFKQYVYNWEKLMAWRELTITTRGEDFKVIEMMFGKGIITSLSRHENLEFDAVRKLLKKRFGKLETKEK